MKKTLVVLLILAVAGGVFAQEFTWSGEVKIGGWLNLHTEDYGEGDETDFTPDKADERGHGKATLGYDNEGFHAEISFEGNFEDGNPAGASIGASASYDAEDWKFNLGFAGLQSGNVSVDSLWGYWYLFDQMVKIDLAYKGPETIYWRVSDIISDNDWDNLDGRGGVEINVAPIESLSFGVMFPGRFVDDAGVVHRGYPIYTEKFVKPFFYEFVMGVKYEAEGSLAIGAMFQMADKDHQKALVMAKFFLGDSLSLGAEVMAGELGQFGDAGFLSFGANVEYNAAPMTFGFTFKLLEFGIPKARNTDGDLVFNPYLLLEAVEDTLLVKLDLVFRMGNTYDGNGNWTGYGFRYNDEHNSLFITPGIFWNPMGEGISDDPSHGLIFKLEWGFDDFLRASATMQTRLYVGFCWAF